MSFLPENYEGSWTLANSFERQGIGLHSGKKSKVKVIPSELPGFYISFSEEPDNLIAINPDHVRHTPLCTTLDFGNRCISTVEHLLSALVGCGLTHGHIQVSGEEIPLLDGSALPWVEAIKEVGFASAKTPRREMPIVTTPIFINRGESLISATPYESFRLIGMIDFPYKVIGQQMFGIELNPSKFVKEIAPARTFGFVDQVKKLKELGLIKGGALDNALVCAGDSWLNPPLRFHNEPVRHKLLDLIGDLAFVGLPKAQILVYRGSHALHADLASALFRECSTN